MRSICIVNLGIGEILFNPHKGHIGGAELQQIFLAEELARRQVNICVVTLEPSDTTQQETSHYENKNRMNICRIPRTGYSRIPFLEPLFIILNIWSAMRNVNADVYLQGGINFETAFVSLFCKLHCKKFVARIESIGDLVDSVGSKRSFLRRIISEWGLSTADMVIAITHEQKALHDAKWKGNCKVIKNIYPDILKELKKEEPPLILWAGTIRPEWKKPEIFLQLARSIPHARFQMVGGPSKDILFYNTIIEEAKKIPNLEFVGFVPYGNIHEYFSKASIFVNTSDVEGFPNTFIESWLSLIPVVSLHIDPDEVICDNNLGFHSRTFEQMVIDIETLLGDEDLRNKLGMNGLSYVRREHDIRKNVDRFIDYVGQISK